MALSFIKSSGNIISEEFCQAIASETKADFVKDKSFGPDVKKVDEIIAVTFDKLRERWEENRVLLLNNQLDNNALRRKWIIPIFEGLGFSPVYISANLKSTSGVDYHISYKGWDNVNAPLIHMVHSTQDLDKKEKASRTHSNKGPHDCLQQFLNTTNHHWALLTNGKKIRLLRDFYHSITKGFLEFDLEGIFETANSEQFRVLYRILHRSRFENQFYGERETEYDEEGNPVEKEEICLLERFHIKSRETGVKIGNKLRDQVIEAIEKLGNGFAESLNPDEFQNGKAKNLYDEILNIIYRLLFLMFAEQKGWLPVQNLIYAHTYSIGALREMAELGNYSHDHETDLWEGLKITFKLVSRGYAFPTGETINAFGGQLFADHKIACIINLPLANNYLLDVIYRLSYFKNETLANRINYANLAIDELGSVYESLLDYEPKIAAENIKIGTREVKRGGFYLDPRGTERKSSGSYYTDSRLVAQLIESALVPVIDNALKDKNVHVDKETALLSLKVADIACGSGAFLCAALEKMGEQLALIRIGDEDRPTDEQLRSAKRDVLLNCIYGVDLNPMAVELAKFSLWITASLPDMPLTFLDHKLKCGNSLIGATPELIKNGIPEDAFKAVGNDISEICTELRKKVRKQLEQLLKLNEPKAQYGLKFEKRDVDELARLREALTRNKQSDAGQVEKVEEEYKKLVKLERKFMDWLLADVWTAAFFAEKTDHNLELYPTNATLENIRENEYINPRVIEKVKTLSEKFHFFHFHLEFPEVFEKGGFDCIIGNPPWETVEFKTQEYFKTSYPNIASIKTTNKREIEIQKLKESNPEDYLAYLTEFYKSESFKRYLKFSGRFPLTSEGKINLYSKFSEAVLYLTNTFGIIVQGDIGTGFDTKKFFDYLITNHLLKKFHHFHNRGKFFDIHRDTRFALMTVMPNSNKTEFMFNLISFDEIHDVNRKTELSLEDILTINPNTKNAPILNNAIDLKLIRKLYRYPIVNKLDDNNPWKIINHRMLNGSDDSEILKNLTEILSIKEKSTINLISDNITYLPVYESKLIWQYDHRFATYLDVSNLDILNSNPRNTTNGEKENFGFEITSRDYLDSRLFLDKYSSNYEKEWFIIYRNVTGSVNYRTAVATIIPKLPVVLSAYILRFDNIHSPQDITCFLANINSFPFDYVVRRKVGASHLSVYIFDQIPIIPPYFYSFKLKTEISTRVLKLTYTSFALKEYAKDLGYNNNPFSWDTKIRFQLQCELDVIYAHLYDLEKDELDYILETFPIVKRKDIEKYGTYRTKETILKLYDEFAWVREEVEKARRENIA